MARDTLTHGRKTIVGLDLTFGKTTTTPCGKTRPRERTTTDPSKVTCSECRAWAASEERQSADLAEAAARVVREHPEYTDLFRGKSADDFDTLADQHKVNAARWDS